LAAVYPSASNFSLIAGPAERLFCCSRVHLDNLAIHSTQTTGYRCRAEPNGCVRVTIPVRGTVTISSSPGRTATGVAERSAVVCVHDRIDRDVSPGYMGFHFQLPVHQLLAQARSLTGLEHQEDEIQAVVDLQSPAGRALLEGITTSFHQMERIAGLGLGRLIGASSNDFLMNVVAVALLKRARELVAEVPKLVSSSTVERAREFISAHAAEPLRLSVLADTLGVSQRALQLGFKRAIGCTPSEYLLRQRLELAKAQLLAATDAMTVAQVAVSCGFANPGAFAGRYRRAFGELPSETLRRRLRA
jgi:AraC-like DNA-binding protein